MKAVMEIEFDPKIAREMLMVAGFYRATDKKTGLSDKDLCLLAIKQNAIYGITYKKIEVSG